MKKIILLVTLLLPSFFMFSQKLEYKVYAVSTIDNGSQSSPIQKFMTVLKTNDLLYFGDQTWFKLNFYKKNVEGLQIHNIYHAIDNNNQYCVVDFTFNSTKTEMLQYSILIAYPDVNLMYVYSTNPPTQKNDIYQTK